MQITWTPPTLDSFDTAEIIWQKLNQIGIDMIVGTGPVTPTVLTIAALPLLSDDGLWYEISEWTDGAGLVSLLVGQTPVAPGTHPYIVMQDQDGHRHKVDLTTSSGGLVDLKIDQNMTMETPSYSLKLTSTDTLKYLMTITTGGGLTTYLISQTPS